LFVDKLNEEAKELIFNPIVPYPEQMPAVWDIQPKKDEQGNTTFLLKGQQVGGEFKDLMVARYDKQKEQWVWEGIPEIPKEEVMQIEGLETRWNPQTKRWEYFDPKDGLVAGWWNSEQKRFELNSQLTVLRARWKGLYEKATKERLEELDKQEKPEKIPIPLDFAACGEGEMVPLFGGGVLIGYRLGFRRIPIGTKIYSPLAGKLDVFVSVGQDPNDRIFTMEVQGKNVGFNLENQYLQPNQRGFLEKKEVKAGDQIGLIVSGEPLAPIPKIEDCQCAIALFTTRDRLYLAFCDLAQTSQGKFLTF